MDEEKRIKRYADVLLILIKDGEILLSQRKNTGYQDGNYGLVSGHLEDRETFKQGMIREAKEEAGITLQPEDLEVVHMMHRFNGIDREYFSTFIKSEKWSGDITNTEPDKCGELKWYKLDALPINIIPEIKYAIENIGKKIFFSEFGFEKSE